MYVCYALYDHNLKTLGRDLSWSRACASSRRRENMVGVNMVLAEFHQNTLR